MNNLNTDIIRALTPLILASIGGISGTVIMLAAMFTNVSNDRFWAISGLAGNIIAVFAGGAAGAASPGISQKPTIHNRSDTTNIEIEGDENYDK